MSLCNIQSCVYQSSVGPITISEEAGSIVEIMFGSFSPNRSGTPLTDQAFLEISEYLAGKRKEFDIPVSQDGTEVQKAVWDAVSEIPYGQTASYKEISEKCGYGPRIVGNSCKQNRIPVLIPCHRVVRASGEPGGYAWGKNLKKKLIRLEKDCAESA